MAQSEFLARVDDFAEGERRSLLIDDIPALLFRAGGAFYAIEDLCSHDRQPLTEAAIQGMSVTCPRHGARFDITTGKALCMPAIEPVRTFALEVRDGGVYALID